MQKKNNFFILSLLLLGMTSCAPKFSDQGDSCTCQNIVIPSAWETPIPEEMTLEDPSCFLWWEALKDPILISLIMEAPNRNQDVLLARLGSKNILLKTINDVSAEIAKNYIEYRGLQMRLKVLNENIEIQWRVSLLNIELSVKGFFDAEKENRDQKTFESLLVQKPLIHFAMEKIIFHLSTLLSYPPKVLREILCQSQDLPVLMGENPVGYPEDVICHDPSVKEARKQYTCGNKQGFYNYNKVVLETLENAETALTAFAYQKDKITYLKSTKSLVTESFKETKDLKGKGLKDDRDLLLAHQALLSEESSVIQGRIDLLVSYINLYQAISCPWEVPCNCTLENNIQRCE